MGDYPIMEITLITRGLIMLITSPLDQSFLWSNRQTDCRWSNVFLALCLHQSPVGNHVSGDSIHFFWTFKLIHSGYSTSLTGTVKWQMFWIELTWLKNTIGCNFKGVWPTRIFSTSSLTPYGRSGCVTKKSGACSCMDKQAHQHIPFYMWDVYIDRMTYQCIYMWAQIIMERNAVFNGWAMLRK